MNFAQGILNFGTAFIDGLLAAAGQSPFAALGYIMTHGGLIPLFPMMVWMLWWVWIYYVVGIYSSKQSYTLLAVDVPAVNEQSMAAVEQMLVALHGVLFSYNKKDLYWEGMQIEPFSLEIVSIDGYIQYFIRSNTRFVNIVKGAIYAQYPDAEIVEVEDYADKVPSKYPDENYKLWGTELKLAKPDAYPLRTYEFFEHSLTGLFADPMASLLEQMSRLQQGEQVWLQLVITPNSGGLRDDGLAEVQNLIGAKAGYSPGAAERLIFGTLGGIFKAAAPAHFEFEDDQNGARDGELGNFMNMTTGEKVVIEEIQKKITRLQFDTKIRLVYVAKNEVFDRFRVIGGVMGALKQFNSLDLNSFVNGKWTTTSRPTVGMWKYRRHVRETKMISAYQGRSNWNGENPITLSTTELATIFHFPLESAQAPLLSTTESKKAEPPTRLPQQILPVGPAVPVEPVAEVQEEQLSAIPQRPLPQRIPGVEEHLAPAHGIPQAFTPEQPTTLSQSMEGLPPGVTPVASADWQDVTEWNLQKRSKLGYGRKQEAASLMPTTQELTDNISQTVNQVTNVIPNIARAVPQALSFRSMGPQRYSQQPQESFQQPQTQVAPMPVPRPQRPQAAPAPSAMRPSVQPQRVQQNDPAPPPNLPI